MDYEKLDLKVGIEIHQRLDTKKLFCECESSQEEKSYLKIKRKMRPVAGELGKIDPAAIHEYLKDKEFVYKMYPNESCLVESDSEPPHELNRNSLRIILQIAKLLNCDIVDEVHTMRKTVIDGSNTAGFQRTSIIGMGGTLEMKFGTIKIPTLCLEEEAGRIDSRKDGTVVYRLNGLGIPLAEIATDASMKTPQQAQEVAEKLGRLLRSVKVKRGIGSIRQDVNISIEAGARVEIKGFQELKEMSELIRNEVKRQVDLLEIKKKLDKRKNVKEKVEDVTDIFEATKCTFLKKILKKREKIAAGILPGFSGLMSHECGKHTLGKELSYYVKPFGPEGIIHSDEDLKQYKLNKEFKELEKKLNSKKKDVIFVVGGKNCEEGAKSLLKRAAQCFEGVPEETRVSTNSDSCFTRPLPGSGRMYPETDIEPIRITKEKLSEIEIPETIDEKKERFIKQLNLSQDLTKEVIRSEYLGLFEELVEETNLEPKRIADLLTSKLKELRRKEDLKLEKIKKKDLEEIILKLDKGETVEESIPQILKKIEKGEELEDILKEIELISKEKLKKLIQEEITKNEDLIEKEGKRAFNKLMGPIMDEVKGKIESEIVVKELRKKLEEKSK